MPHKRVHFSYHCSGNSWECLSHGVKHERLRVQDKAWATCFGRGRVGAPHKALGQDRCTFCLKMKPACSPHASNLNCGLHGSIKRELETAARAHGSPVRSALPKATFSDIVWLARNWLWWEYLHQEMGRGCKSGRFHLGGSFLNLHGPRAGSFCETPPGTTLLRRPLLSPG